MKPALQLKMGQHLTMTPQLQQAIRLLQLSTLDLQAEIQEVLETNPLLEIDEIDNLTPNHQEQSEFSDNNESSHDAALEKNSSDDSSLEAFEALEKNNLLDETPLDQNTDDGNADFWEASAPSSSGQRDAESEAEYYGSAAETLQDHLLWQLNLTPFSQFDQIIALALIDSINDDGYLTSSIEEILSSLQSDEYDFELDEIEAVLHRIQHFDPLGICARNLSECLILQLSQFPDDSAVIQFSRELILNHLELLGQKNYKQILKVTKKSEPELKQALEFIQSLDPKPGARICPIQEQYVIPDVYVRKIKGRWQVALNPEVAPKIRINQTYADMRNKSCSTADSQFIKGHLQEAKWFIKSLESRNETLLKVSQKIVDEQQGFFDYGEEAMKPLVLSTIAEAVEMHESTISRVTTQKYLHSPKGIFELKFFFSSHVNTSSGGSCSSTAIRALLKKLVDAENPGKPLSDSKLANILTEQGIMVARRTVAKYRESLNIPSSSERKTLI
ncbi:MAG: RNA polymerase factor sigma-54 [Gammaproteobacteria bacterium CG22_combo_CG10-13_8_21_14_all_40_8]|nr:MAG: RNA polymerase factor sigma-54 [Gammaproteobacteria bacterium CG22_combo_CG10-13_8_21_14_all_40_8]